MKKVWIIISIIVGVLLVSGIGIFIYIKTAFLNKDEIKEIIIEDANVSSKDIYFENVDLDLGEGKYEVDLFYDNSEYEYKLDAKTGQIIYNDFPKTKNNETESSTKETNTNTITLDEAKDIALKDAKIIQTVNFTKQKKEFDDGTEVYDIEFIYDNYEYEYEINATTGEIITFDKDKQR